VSSVSLLNPKQAIYPYNLWYYYCSASYWLAADNNLYQKNDK